MKDYSGTTEKVSSGMVMQSQNYNSKYVKVNNVTQSKCKPSTRHSGVAKNDSMSIAAKQKGGM